MIINCCSGSPCRYNVRKLVLYSGIKRFGNNNPANRPLLQAKTHLPFAKCGCDQTLKILHGVFHRLCLRPRAPMGDKEADFICGVAIPAVILLACMAAAGSACLGNGVASLHTKNTGTIGVLSNVTTVSDLTLAGSPPHSCTGPIAFEAADGEHIEADVCTYRFSCRHHGKHSMKSQLCQWT